MKPKITAARALTAYIGQRWLRLVTNLSIGILVAALVIIGLLSYYLSAWWWLLALPVVAAGLVFFSIRWALRRIIRRIYRHPFSRTQREQLDSFSAKVVRLIETRSTPLPIFALVTLWDILRRRDATTLRQIINDSTSLKKDFTDLENLFSQQ